MLKCVPGPPPTQSVHTQMGRLSGRWDIELNVKDDLDLGKSWLAGEPQGLYVILN